MLCRVELSFAHIRYETAAFVRKKVVTMSNKKRSKGSKSKKSSPRKSVVWGSILYFILNTGLTMTDDSKFNFDFSGSQFNVIITKAAPCCDTVVALPYV